jgi:probable rRNA maturation factor
MRKQAREIGHSDKEEFYRLLVHGILHLLGFDHEKSAYEEKRMQEKEDECLQLILG